MDCVIFIRIVLSGYSVMGLKASITNRVTLVEARGISTLSKEGRGVRNKAECSGHKEAKYSFATFSLSTFLFPSLSLYLPTFLPISNPLYHFLHPKFSLALLILNIKNFWWRSTPYILRGIQDSILGILLNSSKEISSSSEFSPPFLTLFLP